jgi:hypothetical protein
VQVEVNPHWFTSLHLVFIIRNEKGSDVREDKMSKLPGISRNVSTLIITRNIVGCCNSNGILGEQFFIQLERHSYFLHANLKIWISTLDEGTININQIGSKAWTVGLSTCEFLSIDLDSHLLNTGISEIPATTTKQSQFTKKNSCKCRSLRLKHQKDESN